MFRTTWRRVGEVSKEGAHAEHQDGGTDARRTGRRVACRDRADRDGVGSRRHHRPHLDGQGPRLPRSRRSPTPGPRRRASTVEVVQKDFGQIRDDLKTVQAETAPDVIVGAHDWVGELSANGSIVPLFPSTATTKQFPAYALNAFSYGTAVKKLYGAPVALENIALVDEHEAREGADDVGAAPGARARDEEEDEGRRSASPSSRARAVTRTTCTRSSPGSAATSSARTRPATSTRRTSASRTRSS